MINIIAAIGKNRELGKDNKLLWHIPADMERFKKLTTGQVVIMGRKTYESLPEKFRPLPNRINIVVTKNQDFTPVGCAVCHSIEEALERSKIKDQRSKKSSNEVFIIGGASIYQQGIKYCDKLYLTLVGKDYPEADAFFPDYSQFKTVLSEENHEEKGMFFKFIDLAK